MPRDAAPWRHASGCAPLVRLRTTVALIDPKSTPDNVGVAFLGMPRFNRMGMQENKYGTFEESTYTDRVRNIT